MKVNKKPRQSRSRTCESDLKLFTSLAIPFILYVIAHGGFVIQSTAEVNNMAQCCLFLGFLHGN